MALSVTFQIPLQVNVAAQAGQVTVPLSVGVSIGEPKVVTHQPKPQFDPQIRCCAQCGHNYRDTSPEWNIYPQCGNCRIREEEQHRLDYERELASPRRVPPPRLPSFDDVNNVNWQEEGF